ncbi:MULTISPECIES: MFS transporter [Arthrobacter]|uniref:MFS transporter n=2 Tax=Arthrobacter TaxID=1663 RepID=A0ABU9KPK2_9MICC|nr:MFS transporter [Arthrobacter sp. YJM1]MDP5227984.1 MFS transporter [Arthrobacter sp. YJM1]
MRRLLADLTPLRESPAFKRLWIGTAVSNAGSQLTVVALSLEVYKITQESSYVGLLSVFALVPLVIAGLFGGSVADAHDRRTVAILASAGLWLSAVVLALQAWFHLDNVWLLFAMAAVQSAALGFNAPARSAMIPLLIRPELLASANALNMITFGLATMVGPLLGGFLVASLGFEWTYTLDAVSFFVIMWALFRLPAMPPEGEPRKVGLSSVVEGFRFLGTRPNLRMTFIVDLIAMISSQPRALLPAIGAVMLGGGESTVGILLASFALGAFLAGLFSGPMQHVRRQGVAVVVSVMGWGASLSAFGLMVVLAGDGGRHGVTVWLLPAALCCAAAGVADSISAVFRSTILQAATPDEFRGRLQGVFIVVVAGGPRLGDMLAGGATTWFREGWVLLVGGLVCIVATWAVSRMQRGFLDYDARNPTP